MENPDLNADSVEAAAAKPIAAAPESLVVEVAPLAGTDKAPKSPAKTTRKTSTPRTATAANGRFEKSVAAVIRNAGRKPTVSSKKAGRTKSVVAAPAAAQPKTKITRSRETTLMATAAKTKKVDLGSLVTEARDKSKMAYQKGSAILGEVGGIAKGNVGALAASGKVVSEGLKDLSASSAANGRQVLETVADDLKALAAVKTPSELLLLQGKLAARNFDAVLALATKNTSIVREFANMVFAPLSAQTKANIETVRKAV